MSIRTRIEKDKAITRYANKKERDYFKKIMIDARKALEESKKAGVIDKDIKIIIREEHE